MYLQTRDVSVYAKNAVKLKHGRYYHNFEEERAGLQLQQFTVQKSAMENSKNNKEEILLKAASLEIPTVIISPNAVQFVGQKDITTPELLTEEQIQKMDEHHENRWSGSRWRVDWSSDNFELLELNTAYETTVVLTSDSGFYHYDGTKFNKITNRQEQINQLWAYGFPSKRGRPLRVGVTTESGTKVEIEQLVRWLQQMDMARSSSDINYKVKQIFNTLNRHYCWPEYW